MLAALNKRCLHTPHAQAHTQHMACPTSQAHLLLWLRPDAVVVRAGSLLWRSTSGRGCCAEGDRSETACVSTAAAPPPGMLLTEMGTCSNSRQTAMRSRHHSDSTRALAAQPQQRCATTPDCNRHHCLFFDTPKQHGAHAPGPLTSWVSTTNASRQSSAWSLAR